MGIHLWLGSKGKIGHWVIFLSSDYSSGLRVIIFVDYIWWSHINFILLFLAFLLDL